MAKWKCIIADEENGQTTKECVFAEGDAVTGAATVILAKEQERTVQKELINIYKVNKQRQCFNHGVGKSSHSGRLPRSYWSTVLF
jgi:NADPH-dependent glutamate synthase beta subunit-like oxidoreductase